MDSTKKGCNVHYYSFNIGDYIKQTAHLSAMEDICYRRLLDMYYETEQPIPTETQRVSRRLRLDTALVDLVLNEFFTLTENGWANARCDAEIIAYHTKAETARSNGKLGGRPKKTKRVNLANPELTQPKAKQEPRTINQEPILKPLRKKSAPMPPDFGLNDASTAYATTRNLKITDEIASFTNWHTAKGSTFKDWQAAWRTWCDKAVEFGRAKGGLPHNGYESEKDRSRRETYEAMTGRKHEQPDAAIDGFAVRLD